MSVRPGRAALMIQGTGSDVGKSLLVAGLCRLFSRQGLRVAPFKPQNMSNNAAVTADGGEIGRAQALQARACGLAPRVDMNPILLKPQSDVGAQLVVGGRVRGAFDARAYATLKASLLPEAVAAFRRLQAEADLVLVEGAGSPAEINLRTGDIANMGFAEATDLPVVLVGDIDRGGVIAAIVGTHVLLPPTEQARLKGFIINKFRGDPSLFDDGLTAITARTGLPGLGVVPWCPAATRLPAEDAAGLGRAQRGADGPGPTSGRDKRIKIAVPHLSRIANFDDLDPLRLEPDVCLSLIPAGHPLPGDADLVILPGSKSTLGDLAFLRAQGWDIDLRAHHRRGGHILGLCAGYQMLGRVLSDPDGSDGPAGSVDGLGYLDLQTTLAGTKTLAPVTATCLWPPEACPPGERSNATAPQALPVSGYEMHIGRTSGPALGRPFLSIDTADGGRRPDGAIAPDGRVAGCYVHGLFTSDAFRRAWLESLGADVSTSPAFESSVDAALDDLATHLAAHVNVAALLRIAADSHAGRSCDSADSCP